MQCPCHRQGIGLSPVLFASVQASEQKRPHRRRRGRERGAQTDLRIADIALPALDERAIRGLERRRRSAALHRALGRGDAGVDRVEQRERLGRRGTQHSHLYASVACVCYIVCILRRVPGPFGRVAAPPPHFPVGGPVPSADLVGRETYIRRIGERLADGNHVLLAGPRRIGKTSIILEVARRLRRKGALTAYVDCLGATDIRGLGERLVDALLENVSGVERSFEQAKAIASGVRPSVKVKYEHVELALELAREKNAQRFFEGAMDLPRALAARSGKRVVV